MNKTVNLKCTCGAVQGQLQIVPKAFFHVYCLCCDCQNFATYLNNESKILDAHGGTELFQTYPTYMHITEGHEHIAAVQVKEKGLYRWHTTCCQTPIANTMRSAKVPFVGIIVNFMDFESDQEKRNALGPVIMKAFGKYAKGEMPADAHPKFPLSFMPKIMGFMLKGMLTKKHQPSPFFKDGKPIGKVFLFNK